MGTKDGWFSVNWKPIEETHIVIDRP
jgi:hypothetical protein